MNNKRICFITCVNDEAMYEESLKYINYLNIPQGYEIETIAIKNAKSVSVAYNEAMKKSDAKYKIYLHEDVFIINRNILFDILSVLKNKELGMLGVIGSKTILTDGSWRKSVNTYGKIYENYNGKIDITEFKETNNSYDNVMAIDGSIIITQYDIPWREDIFTGRHFYDLSQCLEFKKNGYQIGVAKQESPWVIHDESLIDSSSNYERYKEMFLNEYSEYIFPLVSILIPTYNRPNYFKEAVESAINQTYKNLEIIISDNSTHDGCKNMIEPYLKKHPNIRYNKNERYITIVDNLKKCLALANGEYASFLMDDDIYFDDKINTMMNYYLEYEDISLVTAYGIRGDEYGDPLDNTDNETKLFDKDTIIEGNVINKCIYDTLFDVISEPTTPIFRTKDINQSNFGMIYGRDYEIIYNLVTFMNIISTGKLAYISKPLSYFRVHDDQFRESGYVKTLGANELYTLINESYLNVNVIDKVKYIITLKTWVKKHKKIFKYTTKINESITGDEFEIFKIFNQNYNEATKKIDEYENEELQNLNKIKNKEEIDFYKLGVKVVIHEGFESNSSKNISIGDNVIVEKDCSFMMECEEHDENPKIIIENGCNIGKRCIISALNKILIDKNVRIDSNVCIVDHEYEYNQIGVPIMHQGINSFTNEVTIGKGTCIGSNSVITGNVTIGRGCVISPNSLVNKDLPDYCIAVGNPVRIVKAFDRLSKKWVEVESDEHLATILKCREEAPPILSICIPTYNRSSCLEKCLGSIYDQIGNDKMFEVIVCDNNSSDDTKSVADKYLRRYENIRYYRNDVNIGGDKNIFKVMELAKGEYINPHGDDDYFEDGFIYKLINIIYQQPACDVFYLDAIHQGIEKITIGQGVDDYLKYTSIYCTFITALVLKRDAYLKLKNRDEFIETALNQTYITFKMLRDNANYCIVQGNIFSETGDETASGYNMGEVFIKNYIELLEHFNINKKVIFQEKRKAFRSVILPWYELILRKEFDLSIENFKELFVKYYKDDPNFEDLYRKVKSTELKYLGK